MLYNTMCSRERSSGKSGAIDAYVEICNDEVRLTHLSSGLQSKDASRIFGIAKISKADMHGKRHCSSVVRHRSLFRD